MRFVMSFCVFVVLLALPVQANMAADAGVYLNQTRATNGRAPLANHSLLNLAAQRHADDMATKRYFSHRSKNGDSFSKRIKKTGLRPCKLMSENIARGQQSVSHVMTTWINSPSHQRNNLSRRVTHYGFGHSNGYWVMVFAGLC